MIADEGSSEKADVDQLIRALYVWAIINKHHDVHISGRGNEDHPTIFVNIRSEDGFRNFRLRYESADMAKRWQSKLFELTGTPQGASTPEMASSRFDIAIPESFANAQQLVLFDDELTYNVNVRVEYKKTYNGFAFITRLLDAQNAPELEELGLQKTLMRAILAALHLPSGLILTTGPTGSGKTTLQRAMLEHRNDGSCAIETVEDPVELALRGIGPIRQVAVYGNITFPRALRSALRSDPDIIVIGEIRDLETLDIALQAAATGHIVLATLHTNSPIEAITRMLDLAPAEDRADYAYRIASALRLVLGQRLLNRFDGDMCDRKLNGTERDWLRGNGIAAGQHIRETVPRGKRIGRVPLIEAVVMTPGIQRLVRAAHVNVSEIYKEACDQIQYEPLAVGGLRAVQSFGATLDEAIKVLEGNMEAQHHPCLRARLATEYNLSFQQVADAIDEYQTAIDNGEDVELSAFVVARRAQTQQLDTAIQLYAQEAA